MYSVQQSSQQCLTAWSQTYHLLPSLNVQTCHASGGWINSLSPRRPVFYSRRVHAAFGVSKMVIGQVYFQALQLFFSVSIIPPTLCTHSLIHHRLYII
jgi:hypothetical protein